MGKKSTKGLNHLYAGNWNTSDQERFAKITASELSSPKLFLISTVELLDTDLIKFNIHVDQTRLSQPFHEGSSVLVEGKNITIEQINAGAHLHSTWQIVQEDEIAYDAYNWEVDLSDGVIERTLIAAFTNDREFVLQFNRTSKEITDLASMEVVIDDTPITRDETGNPIAQFLEGNSLIAKGKVVAVMITKSDTNKANKFSGNLKLAKV